MTEIFIPTLYYMSDCYHIYNSVVVGLFDNEEDAIKTLFGKLMEENYIDLTSFKEYDDEYQLLPLIKDDIIDIAYNNFNQRKEDNKNLNQNLRHFMKYELSFREEFGQEWCCGIETQIIKPVMK